METQHIYLDSNLLAPFSALHNWLKLDYGQFVHCAEQNALYIQFLPQTSQEGFKCATSKEWLRTYCPNIYFILWMDGFSFSAEKLSSMIWRSHSGCRGGDYSATWVEGLQGRIKWRNCRLAIYVMYIT